MNLIKTDLVGEVVVCKQHEVQQAKHKYPGKVIYFESEIEELKGASNQALIDIHNAKDVFGGHLLGHKPKPLTLKQMRKL